jgi:hypothetical protein
MRAILCLVRQDPARIGLIRAVLTCLGVGILMRVVPDLGEEFTSLTADNLPGGFPYMYLVFTGLVASFVLSANAWTRSSRLAVGLPIPSRTAWAVRTGWLVVVALASLAVLALTTGASYHIGVRRFAVNPVVALAAARAAATVLLLTALYQLPQAARDRIPIGPPYVVYVIGISIVTLLLSAAQILSLVGTLCLLAVAGAIAVYLYVRIPPTFSSGPTVEESDTPIWTPPNDAVTEVLEPDPSLLRSADRRWPALWVHWVLFRGIKWNLLTWVHLILVAASALVVVLEFFKGTNAYLALFFMAIYALPLFQSLVEGMPPFDPLPISRRVLWAHGFGAIVGAVAIGAGMALAIFAANPLPFSQVNYAECCVKVPWDYFEVSRDGSAPTITAPWGESHTPTTFPLWRGRTPALYDPYEVGPESSPRFIELQMRRAAGAVYGIPVPAELASPSYLAPPNIAGGAERGGFTLAATRGRLSADRNRSAAMTVLLASCVGTLLVLFALMQYGSSAHRKIFKWALYGCLILFGVTALGVSIGRLLGSTEIWYAGALFSIGARSLAHWVGLPGPVLWLVCVTFWAATYLVLGRVFATIEFPREKTMNRFAEEY